MNFIKTFKNIQFKKNEIDGKTSSLNAAIEKTKELSKDDFKSKSVPNQLVSAGKVSLAFELY